MDIEENERCLDSIRDSKREMTMLWIHSRKVVDEMIVQIFRAILRLGYVAIPDDVPLCEIPR